MKIDYYVEQRNAIQLKAEKFGKEFAETIWVELGVANRHIERVFCNTLPLTLGLEIEMNRCLKRVEKLVEEKCNSIAKN